MAKLIAIEGPLTGQSFLLSDVFTIGRAEDCSLPIDDLGVSRRHAQVSLGPNGATIEDLGSSNGTLVNGQNVASPTALKDQDVVEIYQHVFRFAEADAPRPMPDAPTVLAPPLSRVGGGATASQPLGIQLADGDSAAATIEGTLDMGATIVGGVFTPSAAGDTAKANERLQSVMRISNALQTELDLNALLGLVLDNLFQVFRLADRGFLMLYDEAGELTPAASRSRQGQTEEISLSRSIVREVTDKRVAVLSSDAMSDDRFVGAVSVAGFNIRSMMCAPLIAKEDLLGIIHVDTTRPGARFTQDDLELLCGVTAQTALAIASAKMHERLLVRDRTERDLKVATQVQVSFLPRTTPEVPGVEFAAFYQAALDIGGDLYDFIRQSDDSMIVVLGDVAGKGVPAALLMARMSSDVRFYSMQEREPADVMPHLNRRMDELGMADAFVTMALTRLDLETHEVMIANAAHCMALVRRAAEGDAIEVGDAPGFPLGVMPDFEYTQVSYALQPGDVVCLVSDGVTEAMNAAREQYGEERLARTVAAAPRSAQGVLDAVMADVKAHVGDTKQSDDVTCVCFGVTAQTGDGDEADDEDILVLELVEDA